MPYHSTPLDLAFHALSDPTRRAVVSRLAEGEVPVSALAEPFDMALPSFAQHLKVLEDCGLIASEKPRAQPLVPAGAGALRRGGRLDGSRAPALGRAVGSAGSLLGQDGRG